MNTYYIQHNFALEWFIGTHLAILMFYIYYKIYLAVSTQNIDENMYEDELVISSEDLPQIKDYLKCLGKDIFGETAIFNFESDDLGTSKLYEDDIIDYFDVKYIHNYFIKMLIYNYKYRINDLNLPNRFIYNIESDVTDETKLKLFVKQIIHNICVNEDKNIVDGASNMFDQMIPRMFESLYKDPSNDVNVNKKLLVEEVNKSEELTELEKEMNLIDQ